MILERFLLPPRRQERQEGRETRRKPLIPRETINTGKDTLCAVSLAALASWRQDARPSLFENRAPLIADDAARDWSHSHVTRARRALIIINSE
jgi:hypothetical protein